jgi:uncharacterized protein YneF (UPF0154 family)
MIDGAEDKVGACWECGYSLRGLETPRCPECGRAFNPNDPTTMNMGIAVGPVKRWLMRPPGWPLYLLTGVAAVVSVWAAAAPTPAGAFVDVLGSPDDWSGLAQDVGSPYGRFLWAALLWTILLGAWIVRRVARGITVLRLSKQKAPAFAYWRRWLCPLLIFLLTVLCCLSPLPVIGGFWLSRKSLEATVKAGGPTNSRAPWIGIYPVSVPPSAVVQTRVGQEWIFVWKDGGFVHVESEVAPDERLVLPWQTVSIKRVAKNWFTFRLTNGYEP